MSAIMESTPPATLLEQMVETADYLGEADDLSEVLARLARRGREVTGADYAAISVFGAGGGLERFVYAGLDESELKSMAHPPEGLGLLGELARRDRPLRLEDLHSSPDSAGWPDWHPPMEGFLGAPFRAGGRTIGSFYMTRKPGGAPFTDNDELAASILAAQAGQRVWTVLAREREARIALLEERTRIAADLHDGTVQMLFALGLELDSLRHEDDATPQIRERIAELVERINDLIRQVRGYIEALETPRPEGPPELARDLTFVVQQIVPRGIDTVVNITAPSLQEHNPREAEDLLYIAREALSNAARHSGATKIGIDLRQTPGETALTIQDNGGGFEASTIRPGLGTITMRTRTERLGGQLTVLSIPGMGTTVRVIIPREESRHA